VKETSGASLAWNTPEMTPAEDKVTCGAMLLAVQM
jgi:hypothetical protein